MKRETKLHSLFLTISATNFTAIKINAGILHHHIAGLPSKTIVETIAVPSKVMVLEYIQSGLSIRGQDHQGEEKGCVAVFPAWYPNMPNCRSKTVSGVGGVILILHPDMYLDMYSIYS